MTLTNLSLFSGAGGLDLGARMVGGFKTVAYVEYDRYAQGVLMSRMRSGDLDDAPIFEDVRTFDGRCLRGSIDVISGGFPCQPHSTVGKKLGGGGDERNLWPDYLRIVCQCRPSFVLGENVSGIFDTGYALQVLCDLEESGYCATPLKISACSVGGPHMRDRVFFLAHAKSLARPKADPAADENGEMRGAWLGHICRSWKEMASPDWTIPPSWILRDIDGVERRMDRTRCSGNGVVPQAAAKAWQKIKDLADL